MRKNFFLITISDLLFEFAHNLIFVFGVILFYQKLGNSVILAVLPLALLHLVHGSLVPFFAKLLFKIGIKKSLFIGATFYALGSTTLYLDSNLSWPILILWSILQALGNIFHYIPVIYILGHNTSDNNRGRIFGLRKIAFILLALIHPVLGGFIAQIFDLNGLTILAFGLYVTSMIPILFINDFKANLKLNLKASLRTLSSKKLIIFRSVRVTADNFNVFWPLFIFLILKDSFIQVGILFTAVNFISILIAYITSKTITPKNELHLYSELKWAVTLVWFLRVFTFNYWSALITDTVYKLNDVFKSSVLDIIDFDLLNNKSHSDINIDNIIIREITSNIATSIFYIFSGLIITLFGFYDSFIFIGILSFIGMSLAERVLTKQ